MEDEQNIDSGLKKDHKRQYYEKWGYTIREKQSKCYRGSEKRGVPLHCEEEWLNIESA